MKIALSNIQLFLFSFAPILTNNKTNDCFWRVVRAQLVLYKNYKEFSEKIFREYIKHFNSSCFYLVWIVEVFPPRNAHGVVHKRNLPQTVMSPIPDLRSGLDDPSIPTAFQGKFRRSLCCVAPLSLMIV